MLGYFSIKTAYRNGLEKIIHQLRNRFKLALISGDNDAERNLLTGDISVKKAICALSKSHRISWIYTSKLQKGEKMIMIGDGLNDAGALKQSNVGIVITDDINNFSPASDAILDGSSFIKLPAILAYCRNQKTIIYGSFIISILYHLVGSCLPHKAACNLLLPLYLCPSAPLALCCLPQA